MICKRPADHKFVVLSWQRIPARFPHPAGYAPYEVMCRRCGETDTNDDLGGTVIGEYEAHRLGLEVFDSFDFDVP